MIVEYILDCIDDYYDNYSNSSNTIIDDMNNIANYFSIFIEKNKQNKILAGIIKNNTIFKDYVLTHKLYDILCGTNSELSFGYAIDYLRGRKINMCFHPKKQWIYEHELSSFISYHIKDSENPHKVFLEQIIEPARIW